MGSKENQDTDVKKDRDILFMVSPILENNPRRIKHFINLFRLKVYIVHENGILFSEKSPSNGLTLEIIGKFVAISLKWPLLISHLKLNNKLLEELQKLALDSSYSENVSIEAKYWINKNKLAELLRYGCFDKDGTQNMEKQKLFSFSDINISILLEISPESYLLDSLFSTVTNKIEEYFEEPFRPYIFYNNWKLNILFDDPEKLEGKLTVRAGNRTLLNRLLTKEEIENNRIEIDYLQVGYFPENSDEILLSTPRQKEPIIRFIDYFENIGNGNKTRILQHDCSSNLFLGNNLRIAAVQLKYQVYAENSVVKIRADEAYYLKVMEILTNLKEKTDIIIFPEFSIPFDYLAEIQKFADENKIIVVAGSHYVMEENLNNYVRFFNREFGEIDLQKHISPVVIPNSKIVHNEKTVNSKIERDMEYGRIGRIIEERDMKYGKVNHIFKLQDDLRIGVMISNEYLYNELRLRLIPTCDVILVPQANPNPRRFYETAKADITNPLFSAKKAFIMANGIFTLGDDKKILGGSTGIVLTLDTQSYKRQDEGIITPVDMVMEQFILLTSINTGFNLARDINTGQIPIETKLIHIFEESELLSNLNLKGSEFIQLLDTIKKCENRDELKKMLEDTRNKEMIKTFSPLMHKHIQYLDNLTFEEIKNKTQVILIQNDVQ